MAIADAIARRDIAAIETFLTRDFVHRALEGQLTSRDAFLDGISLIPGEIVFVRVSDLDAHIAGGGALVTGVQRARVRLDAALVDDERAFVDWFLKDGASWRLRMAMDLPMPSPARG